MSLDKWPNIPPEVIYRYRASHFRGSVLLSGEILENAKEIKAGIFPFQGQENRDIQSVGYQIYLDVRAVYHLKGDTGEYRLKLTCGASSAFSKGKVHIYNKAYNSGSLAFFERVNLNLRFEGQKEQLPDIIVYLCKGDDPISFYRISVSDIRINDQRYNDIKMLPEKSYNPNGKALDSGFLNARFAVTTEQGLSGIKGITSLDNEEEIIPWSSEPRIDRSSVRRLSIIVNLYMGRNLISADEDGLCDPTLMFDHLGSTARSSTYSKSLNPVWNERIVIASYLYDNWLPPLIVKCLDRDERLIGGDAFESLGVAIVKLGKSQVLKSGDPNALPKPDWYLVRDELGANTASLLLGVAVLVAEAPVDPRSLAPLALPRDRFLLKLYILGLRDLQSAGLFAVKRPFLKFHAGALKSSAQSKGGNAFDILTSRCKKGGPNASFADVLT